MVVGLFSFTGCGIVRTDNTLKNSKVSVTIGNKDLTRTDIVNAFYTYYQSNGNYFSNYDEQTIVDSFYSWVIIREIVKQKSNEALYDPETNPNGYIIYSQEEEDEVWEETFDYIYSQVTSYEKSLYELDNITEDDRPIWLREAEKEEEKKLFEAYKSAKPEATKKTKEDSVAKSTDDQKKAKLEALKTYLFEYKVNPNDEDDKTREKMNASDSAYRNKAYAKYINGLQNSAKASETKADEKTMLESELVRIYNAYYDSKIQTLFQNYYLKEQLVDTTKEKALSDREIVNAYLKKYYTDMQVYQVEDSYISTMTSKDGSSVVFYNYNGRNYFFTVQHILVKYDDYMSDKVKNLDGYPTDTNVDYDYLIYQNFARVRNNLTNSYKMLTEINQDVVEDFGECVKVVGNYYYYDKTLEGDSTKDFGYILLTETTENEEKVYKRTDNGEVVDAEDVKFMASKEDIIDAYNQNVSKWSGILSEYLAGDDAKKQELRETYEKTAYILDVIDNMKSYDATNEEILNKISSLLFVELQWVYSADSLDNKTSNKLGYTISNYPDENGSWVADFAYGARNIMSLIESGRSNAEIDNVNVVISNYGYHIIKVENVYKAGSSLVDMSSITGEINLDDENFVSQMANLLKKTYVSTSSNQTVYDYFYDELYNTLAGSSSASGTYFLKLQYEWLNDYEAAGKTNIINKMTYTELMESIN